MQYKDYQKLELPKVRLGIKELKAELGNIGRCMKLRYLWGQRNLEELNIARLDDHIKQMTKEHRPKGEIMLAESFKADALKRLHGIKRKIEHLVYPSEGDITHEDIERAREYPIEELMEFNKNKAHCINHEENTASMSLKNNRVHCFGCGWSGDAIDVYMKRNGVGFKDAVKALRGG